MKFIVELEEIIKLANKNNYKIFVYKKKQKDNYSIGEYNTNIPYYKSILPLDFVVSKIDDTFINPTSFYSKNNKFILKLENRNNFFLLKIPFAVKWFLGDFINILRDKRKYKISNISKYFDLTRNRLNEIAITAKSFPKELRYPNIDFIYYEYARKIARKIGYNCTPISAFRFMELELKTKDLTWIKIKKMFKVRLKQ